MSKIKVVFLWNKESDCKCVEARLNKKAPHWPKARLQKLPRKLMKKHREKIQKEDYDVVLVSYSSNCVGLMHFPGPKSKNRVKPKYILFLDPNKDPDSESFLSYYDEVIRYREDQFCYASIIEQTVHPKLKEQSLNQIHPEIVEKWDVFLSYSKQDAEKAKELEELLFIEGVDVFMYAFSTETGKNWKSVLKKAIRQAKLFVVLLTPQSLKSDWVLCEIGAAWIQDKKLMPCLLGVNPDDIPAILNEFQCNHGDFEELVKSILKALSDKQ